MLDNEKQFQEYISVQSIDEIKTEELIEIIGKLCDLSYILKKSNGCKHCIKLSKKLLNRDITSLQRALLFYFMANTYEDMRRITTISIENTWKWEQIEIEKQLIYLRSSINEKGFEELDDYRKCQIYTNLGNILDHIGRSVEAIEYWDKALEIIPQFAMAIGNKGQGLFEYSKRLYDDGHRACFLKYTYDCIKKALDFQPETREAYEGFNRICSWIRNNISNDLLTQQLDCNKYSIGETNEESAYRKWCLENRLFLNPLNDLGTCSIAARDVLLLPSIVLPIGQGPYYQGFYNQMKQEYISARFMYYEGTSNRRTHFSDKEVFLYNTLDYPCYCLNIERIKASFRIVYSIFDKIGFFLNHYLKLGISEKNVSFRKLWYDKKKGKDGKLVVREEFKVKPNWPLRGLFWLSKDLYIPNFKEAVEPDAQEISNIRNHLEHKYLKVHNHLWFGSAPDEIFPAKALEDSLVYSVRRKEFERKTLKLIKLTRAALIYLSQGIHMEERQREKDRDPNAILPNIELTLQDDDWKR